LQRYLAGFWQRLLAARSPGSPSDEERLAGGFDDFGGDGVEVVYVHDALDLAEQPVDEAEVPAGDPRDGGDATLSVNSSVPLVSPSVCQRRASTAVSSSAVRGRYSWANPIRL